ncbi:TonB-dependent receptor [Chitinophaga pinensis]|uniref:TonB-dependent receptor n=1 Tax=Chitinophaga pinensis (strain ATCC 43595 / DSM 2588 / LMG 13176 / NBRC 15968 / NCIMB 11800 / UQM 2034) TaxID=485918 RepID=A0A979G583_CHIPD|nr:TonB-dependent receptor [Chitinophaga pinensis]ACU61064.1 TonB-dependent receptor [Chitinophaga pinensis DSM 2588]
MFLTLKVASETTTKRFFLTVLFISLCLPFAYAQQGVGALRDAITCNMERATLDEVLLAIGKQTRYSFSYDKQAAGNVSIRHAVFNKQPLGKVLTDLQQQATLVYDVDDRQIAVRISTAPRQPVVQPKPGLVSGRVIDEKGEMLPGATIHIIEVNKGMQSSVDGTYNIEIPAGTYTMEVRFISYLSRRITGIIVKAGENTPLDISMKPSSKSLNEVVITADYRKASIEGMFARQKSSAATLDGIVREQILRTPDNNVAQVLNRVSGLNVQDNRFVIVRGLSDRYNNVQLNGSLLPSTEPNARNFAFDVIPSALIDNVVVYKTATPDLPGEFSGGVVDMTTRDIPVENFVRIKLGTGFNTKTTGKDFYGPERGKYDYLGFDDGSRKLPGTYQSGEYAKLVAEGYYGTDTESRKKYGAVSADFPNRFTMYRFTGKPVQDYELNVGRVKQLKDGRRFGGIFALTYRNQQTAQDYVDHAPIEIHYYEGKEYLFDNNLSGLLNLGYSFGKHKLAMKSIFTQKFTERTRLYKGQNLYSGTDIDAFSNFPLYNTIFQSKLEGEHTIGKKGFRFNWNGSLSSTNRKEPDNKRIMGERAPGAQLFGYVYNDANQLRTSTYYSDLKERRYTWSAEGLQPFTLGGLQQQVKAGYQGTYRKADFEAEQFSIRPDAGASDLAGKLTGLPYYEVYDKSNFGYGKLIYFSMLASQNQERGRANGYNAYQRLHAGYLMLDGHFTKQLRFAGGLRVEKNYMNSLTLDTRAKGDGTITLSDTVVTIDKTDWLPSVNLIYEITPKFNVRASYYHSVARPDLRELSFFEYYKPEEDTWVSGDNLRPTAIRNVDLRIEFYPSPQELISFSAFYKKFRDPIELQLEAAMIPAHVLTMQYVNMKSATDLGFEFNFRKSAGFINETSEFLKNLYLSGNFSYLNAKVEYDAEVRIRIDDNKEIIQPARRNRPLFGQAPYIINGGVIYTGKHIGFNAVYNRVGERIIFGSELDEYNEYEKARDVVDLQLNYRFMKNNKAEIKLNAADLLNQPVIRYYNNHKNIWKPNASGVPGEFDQYGNLIIPNDPSGKKYDSRYDELRRKFWYGRNFTISASYTF